METHLEVCPVCGGPLKGRVVERKVHIGSRSAQVPVSFSYCGVCDEGFFAPGQMDFMLRVASDTIRREEGLLTAGEIRGIREGLGLTQADFEKLLGVGPKTVVRWEKGTVFQNRSTDSLLRLVRALPESSRFLGRLHDVDLARRAKAAGR